MDDHIATPYLMSANYRYGIQTALTVLACAGLAACGSTKGMTSGLSESKINPVNWITPYKIDIVQGNFVSSEQVELLKPGMLRAQVREVLGTPLLASVFHADRWDYVFTIKRGGAAPQALRLTVYFKGDVLERFDGDTMPSESDFVAKLDTHRKLGKVPVLELTPEQLQALDKKQATTDTPAAPAASASLPPAATSYPPLEGPAR
jgi:outer membrane protein assembly factor BamE